MSITVSLFGLTVVVAITEEVVGVDVVDVLNSVVVGPGSILKSEK